MRVLVLIAWIDCVILERVIGLSARWISKQIIGC